MTIIVDIKRESHTGCFKGLVMISNGAVICRTTLLRGNTFEQIACSLMNFIILEKPEKIIFDTVGFGLGLYDYFITNLRNTPFYELKADGTIVYSKLSFATEFSTEYDHTWIRD